MKIKLKIFLSGFLASLFFAFTGCSSDKIERKDFSAITVSFKTDVQPIFIGSCATSACHDGSISPDLRTATAYGSLIDTYVLDSVTLTNNSLYNVVVINKTMPKSRSLSQGEMDIITNWIKQGYHDN